MQRAVPVKTSDLKNGSIHVTGTEPEGKLGSKQDALTAGTYIVIVDNAISVDMGR